MKLSVLFSSAARILAPFFLGSVALADVIYVDASGNGQYTAIQPAITAAVDGDVLLLRTGSYAGFTIDNRRLSLIADAGALPKVTGTVVVRNLGASAIVLISGLEIVPPLSGSQLKGLDLANNAGHVRIQACTVHGSQGYDSGGHAGDGGNAASIVNCSKAAFVACSLIGGNGGGIPLFVDYGGYGGHGAVTQGSSVAFYDCLLKGGVGGAADYIYAWEEAGDGGDGCQVLDFGILASGCQFQGGIGGSYATIAGEGGNGLLVNAGQAQLIGNTYAGGLGGHSYGGAFGANGLPQAGPGVFHTFPGLARKIAGPSLAAESSTLQIDVTGESGDRVWLLQTPQPEFVYFPSYAGMRLIALLSSFTVKPDVVLSHTGAASVVLRTHNVPAGVPCVSQYWQCLVENSSGQLRLGSPLHVTVLNCSDLLPDCDGNASCDSCDLLLPGAVDCDRNGVPDGCEQDCNGNGIVDACEISNGISIDENHNTIPDECEPQTTWYVDANAGPGGNGSIGAPFQTLSPAFTRAISGDTVQLANGVYQGAENRDLDFTGRNFIVQGSSAANCIIDCQLLGRAFVFSAGSTSGATLQELTIRNAKCPSNKVGGGVFIQLANPTIRQCVFENCQSPSGGGGIGMQSGNPLIAGCLFVGNRGNSGQGGGVWGDGTTNSSLRILDCDFVGNQATNGAGLATRVLLRMERCSFQGNVTNAQGGGIYGYYCDLWVDQCSIAGNSAQLGGGIAGIGSRWHVSNTTLVDNRGTLRAGAAYFNSGSVSVRTWRNTIFWNNTAPGGTAIEVLTGPFDIDWCDVQGAQSSFTLAGNATLTYGAGNIAQDPLFTDANGLDNNPLTIGDNDYRLSIASPCIDAGANASVPPDLFDLDGDANQAEPIPLDFDGFARFVDVPSVPDTGSGSAPIVDMGPWERP